MKIEIWSDFSCPFCYIGKRNFELALTQFSEKKYVQIEYKSFQLDSQTNKKNPHPAYKAEMTEQICKLAEQAGLTIQFDQMKQPNTFHAHRLMKYAAKHGKETELIELLFQNHFIYYRNIEEKDVLLAIAKEIGLQEEEVVELLSLNRYAKAVGIDELLAREIGIQVIPFFIFNEQYALSGVQSSEDFLSAIKQLWTEEKEILSKQIVAEGECKSTYCEGYECKEEND